MQISPTPNDEEAVAIVAAVEALWPKPMAAEADRTNRAESAWRFSGRWWSGPIARARQRPNR